MQDQPSRYTKKFVMVHLPTSTGIHIYEKFSLDQYTRIKSYYEFSDIWWEVKKHIFTKTIKELSASEYIGEYDTLEELMAEHFEVFL